MNRLTNIIIKKSLNNRNYLFKNLSTIKFTKSHEYIQLSGSIGTVGITDHAANALGDVVYVDLPLVGAAYTAGSSFGSVESVKAASDVYSPVTGEVVEVNAVLSSNPGTVNESPFESGWFIKLKLNDDGLKEFKELLDEAAYKELTKE
mmetsp:Transcript_8553/g.7662  ORF Transcript_8553/g.7662 Transcript_8553/m.7662 type:complete len:148 (+) Transcript_8553:117-560(+)